MPHANRDFYDRSVRSFTQARNSTGARSGWAGAVTPIPEPEIYAMMASSYRRWTLRPDFSGALWSRGITMAQEHTVPRFVKPWHIAKNNFKAWSPLAFLVKLLPAQYDMGVPWRACCMTFPGMRSLTK